MTATRPLRIMLVDDHPVVRAGVRAVLETSPDLEVVAEAGDGQAALTALATEPEPVVDVVLMDLQMGDGLDGIAATRAIRERYPRLPVLILTTFDTEADILAALDAGAAGYLLKDAPSEDLAIAVRRAADGQRALTPGVAERLLHRVAGGSDTLTAREIELLECIARGESNRAAAKTLFISEATVKTHLVHVFQKLGVTSRTEAVAEARRRRIIRG